MKKIILLFSCILINIIVGVLPLHATEEIRFSAPASMTDALKELISQFRVSREQISITPNFGSSGAMAKQINEGAPADLFISANQKWMTFLSDEQRLAPGSEKILASNALVFVGKKNSAVTSMADILKLKQIAIGSPKSVPAGEYTVQAMEKAGIYKQLEEGNQLVMAKDVRQALMYAERGETDGAFVYKTDALLATQAVLLFVVPQDLHEPIDYPIALTAEGAKKPEAQAFYQFLTSPEAMQVFKKYGFSAPKS